MSALPTPWRYQGRILESAPGTPDLYDFGARSYNPTIGTFTSLDSLHGSAGNPALLTGYLYANANANPATLVDPDGHLAGDRDDGRGRFREPISPPSTLCSDSRGQSGLPLDHVQPVHPRRVPRSLSGIPTLADRPQHGTLRALPGRWP